MNITYTAFAASMAVLTAGALSATALGAGEKTTLDALIASNAKPAFTELIRAFEQTHPNVTVKANYLGGSTIGSMIDQGQPADVALAGSSIFEKEAALVEQPTPILRNKEILLVPLDNPGKIASLKDIANPGVKLAVGTPDSAVGKLSSQVIQKAAADFGFEFVQGVRKNIVVQKEKGSEVVAAVGHDANVAIAFASDADPSKYRAIPIDDKYNVVSTYSLAIPKNAKHRDAARALVDFVAGRQGQETLKKYNYMSPLAKAGGP